MPIGPDARQRLATAVDRRQGDLGLPWRDIADAGGLSLKTLYNIRLGKAAELRSDTPHKLDDGLQWERGSTASILDGGEPTAAAPRPAPSADGLDLSAADEEMMETVAATWPDQRKRKVLLQVLALDGTLEERRAAFMAVLRRGDPQSGDKHARDTGLAAS
jgi:hypothetical protein